MIGPAKLVPVGARVEAFTSDGRHVGYWICVQASEQGIWAWRDLP